jgi:hypothetical protein
MQKYVSSEKNQMGCGNYTRHVFVPDRIADKRKYNREMCHLQ